MRVCVVGGGFSGLFSAVKLALSGCRVTVLEEHERVGYPKHCTGIVSPRVVEWVGKPARESVLAHLKAVRVYGSGSSFMRVAGSPLALVLDRPRLEELLLREALGVGVEVRLGCRVLGVTRDGRIATKDGEESFDLVVLAEGVGRRLVGALGLREKARLVRGINVVCEARGEWHGDFVVGFNHALAPGFFYWIVPLGPRRFIVGWGVRAETRKKTRDPRVKARFILRRHGLELERIIEVYGGTIVAGPPSRKLWDRKVIIIGDAGCLNKPVTGGGLYPVSKALSNLPAQSCWDAVKRLVRGIEDVRRELYRQYWIARVLHDPQNQEVIDKIISALRGTRIESEFSRKLEFDKHHMIPRTVIGSPKEAFRLMLEAVGTRRGLVAAAHVLRSMLP